jgi:hypothetical protein
VELLLEERDRVVALRVELCGNDIVSMNGSSRDVNRGSWLPFYPNGRSEQIREAVRLARWSESEAGVQVLNGRVSI